MIPPFPSDLQPRSMGKIFLTFQLVDRQFCGGETREGKGEKKCHQRICTTTESSRLGHYRSRKWTFTLGWFGVYRAYTRGDTRGMAGLITRSGRRHYIIYPRSYNAIREHICHFACPVIILSVKLCGSFSLMLQRRLIQATLLYTSVCAYFNKSSCPRLVSS